MRLESVQFAKDECQMIRHGFHVQKHEPKKQLWMTEAYQEMAKSNGMGQSHHVEKGNEARHQLLVGGGSMAGGILRIKLSLSANPPVGFELPFVECQINWLHRTKQSQ